jgi:hypothetical protein
MGTLSLPRDHKDLVQILSHHYLVFFDNIDSLPPWQSDALCRACTGEAFSKRALYTDDDDFIYKFQRPIGLNGINIAATRPDLLDRSILIPLERISAEKRREEARLEADFALAQAGIVGGMLDALSLAMRLRPTIELTSLPRMADFARWGAAISQALGYSAEDFTRAYQNNIIAQNSEVLEGHPVAAAVQAFMDEKSNWEGAPAELLALLDGMAEGEKIDVKSKSWPKAAHVLTKRLNEIKPNLQEAGITVVTGERTGTQRTITIEKESSVIGDKASSDDAADDDVSPCEWTPRSAELDFRQEVLS